MVILWQKWVEGIWKKTVNVRLPKECVDGGHCTRQHFLDCVLISFSTSCHAMAAITRCACEKLDDMWSIIHNQHQSFSAGRWNECCCDHRIHLVQLATVPVCAEGMLPVGSDDPVATSGCQTSTYLSKEHWVEEHLTSNVQNVVAWTKDR